MTGIKDGLRDLMKSFAFAFKGLLFCVKNERNMRIHIVAAGAVLSFAAIFGLNPGEYTVLILIVGFVLSAEMINASIESVVNLKTKEYDHFARIAKDIAAGAVIVAAAGSVGAGCILFLRFPMLTNALYRIVVTPYFLIPYLLYTFFGIMFVFFGLNPLKWGIKKKGYIQKDEYDEVKIYHIKSK
ncbi:MAG: diacylglycerol kinase family protein [Oscillospiraceae bacterium]|nr:diacylglycerol kinase family protein [Oscillospiraceae bacterium]